MGLPPLCRTPEAQSPPAIAPGHRGYDGSRSQGITVLVLLLFLDFALPRLIALFGILPV
jgi:hypothetical protein